VVLGPPAVLPASGSQLGASLSIVYNVFSGTAKVIPNKIGSGSFVDVRDVAFLHIWAYEHPEEANGQRYIAAASYGPPQGIADILRKKYEGTKIAENITIGVPGNDYQGYNKETGEVDFVEYLPESPRPSGKKAEEATGIKWIPFKQSVIDTAEALEALL
jgi:nucleoside-diphosphate-sugar epimerase